MSVYTIQKNGEIVASVSADDMKWDFTGKNPIMIFIRKDGTRAELDLSEVNEGDATPYINWHS
jgi:hypothetical protein